MDQTHPLADWLEKTGEKQAAFAGKVDISEPHLSLILSGKRGPSLGLAKRIEAATNGKVRAIDLAAAE